MAEKDMSHYYWAEVVSTTVYIIKRTPTTVVHDMMPLEEKFSWQKTYLGHLKVFGCITYVHVPDELRTKLDPKAEKCVFIGLVSKPCKCCLILAFLIELRSKHSHKKVVNFVKESCLSFHTISIVGMK